MVSYADSQVSRLFIEDVPLASGWSCCLASFVLSQSSPFSRYLSVLPSDRPWSTIVDTQDAANALLSGMLPWSRASGDT